MASEVIFEVFDPWSEPDVNGVRLIHRTVITGDPSEYDLSEAVRSARVATDEEFVTAVVRAMGIAYLRGRLDELVLQSAPPAAPGQEGHDAT